MNPSVVVLGDCLADQDWTATARRLCPDSAGPVLDVDGVIRRPGGAGLAALAAARTGADVAFVTALADDAAGRWLHAALVEAGVDVVDLGLDGRTPEKIRLRAGGSTVLRVDRHCLDRPTIMRGLDAVGCRLDEADAVLVSDYGRGLAARCADEVRAVAGRRPVVWDPHPRGATPVEGVALVTPSVGDLPADLAAGIGSPPSPLAVQHAARAASARWRAPVALTCGPGGAVLHDGSTTVVSAEAADGDANGAGDVLAATTTVALAAGDDLARAVRAGVAAASRHVGGRHVDDIEAVRAAHRRGARVVATSGCFDVLHAGHLSILQHARSLGDVLCVCVNSDRSVRALKGPTRPINPEGERVALLRALGCVDHVVVFGEATPCDVLRRLRPHVFVKGGDYDTRTLPERAVLAEWGGTVEIGPYVPDRSTSGLLATARRLAG